MNSEAPPCPCDSGQSYAQCCESLHLGAAAPTAEALMRSRYSAFVRLLENYLLASWHPSTRPTSLDLGKSSQPRWLGLKILATQTIDAAHAEVEFVARFREGGGAAKRLHERSRFVLEAGRWYYVDGIIF